MLHYADAAHSTQNMRYTRAQCSIGQKRSLLTASGYKRVDLNAALNAYEPIRVLPDETIYINAQGTPFYRTKD